MCSTHIVPTVGCRLLDVDCRLSGETSKSAAVKEIAHSFEANAEAQIQIQIHIHLQTQMQIRNLTSTSNSFLHTGTSHNLQLSELEMLLGLEIRPMH